MIYPSFIKKGDYIGICAPSGGVGSDIESFDVSINNIRNAGYRTIESASVRNDGIVSADKLTRTKELTKLLCDDNIGHICFATGGEFLMDILPEIDFNLISKHPKWMQGYSDISTLLYPVTTQLDIATIYGLNAGGFSLTKLHPYMQYALDSIAGEFPTQHSYDRYCPSFDLTKGFTEHVEWILPNGSFKASGRLLGGCTECLVENIAGTKFDGTKRFIEQYRDDGIVWYFDTFSMTQEQLSRALWKMAQLGWFDNASVFLFGRIAFPCTFSNMTYEQAILRELGHDAKIALEVDVGHVKPMFTLVNGAIASVVAENENGTLDMRFV